LGNPDRLERQMSALHDPGMSARIEMGERTARASASHTHPDLTPPDRVSGAGKADTILPEWRPLPEHTAGAAFFVYGRRRSGANHLGRPAHLTKGCDDENKQSFHP
jgi:hypothetical protein